MRAVLLDRYPRAAAVQKGQRPAASTASDDCLARQVLDVLLPPNAIVSAIYQPARDPVPWAADLVGRRIAWVVHPAQERDQDPRLWAMTPHPFQPEGVNAARSVPLGCLCKIEVIGAPTIP